jgi:hypothetical protein
MPSNVLLTFAEFRQWLAEQTKAQPADLAPLGEQLRDLDPAVTAALVTPLVASLHTFQARAKVAGVTSTELHIMHGLAAAARLWADYVAHPDDLESRAVQP